MFKATVYVTLREGVLDPQGNAVQSSLHALGFDEAGPVRVGKFIELELNMKEASAASERLREMCEKLLANTVIEDYRFDLQEV